MTGDSFFSFLADGAIPPWLPAAERQNTTVLSAAAAASGWLAQGGYAVVYDGIVRPWALPAFSEAAAMARVHYAVLLPSVQECLSRVRSRSGHGFADAGATRHMHADFSSGTVPITHVFRPQGESPESTAARVLNALTERRLLWTTH